MYQIFFSFIEIVDVIFLNNGKLCYELYINTFFINLLNNIQHFQRAKWNVALFPYFLGFRPTVRYRIQVITPLLKNIVKSCFRSCKDKYTYVDYTSSRKVTKKPTITDIYSMDFLWKNYCI